MCCFFYITWYVQMFGILYMASYLVPCNGCFKTTARLGFLQESCLLVGAQHASMHNQQWHVPPYIRHQCLLTSEHCCVLRVGGITRALQGVKSVIALGRLGALLPAAERAGVERVVLLSTSGATLLLITQGLLLAQKVVCVYDCLHVLLSWLFLQHSPRAQATKVRPRCLH